MEQGQEAIRLTLLQEIVLLALDDKGWFGASEPRVRYGLVAACLFRLWQQGRLRITRTEITIDNPRSTDELVPDRIFHVIRSSPVVNSPSSWFRHLAGARLLLRKTTLKQMIKEGVIGKEEYSLLGMLTQNKYPLRRPDLKQQCIERLLAGIRAGNFTDEADVMFLVIMRACRMLKKNFSDQDDYDTLRDRIDSLLLLYNPEGETGAVIRIIESALVKALRASGLRVHL